MDREQPARSVDESFRDSIATVDQQGKRIWIYPKKPVGKYHGAPMVRLRLLACCLPARSCASVASRCS
jgi:hypothetical protein